MTPGTANGTCDGSMSNCLNNILALGSGSTTQQTACLLVLISHLTLVVLLMSS